MKRQVFKFNDIKSMLNEDEMKGVIGGCGTSGWEWGIDPQNNLYYRPIGSDTWIRQTPLNEVVITAPAVKPPSATPGNGYDPLTAYIIHSNPNPSGGYFPPSTVVPPPTPIPPAPNPFIGGNSSTRQYEPKDLKASTQLAEEFLGPAEGGFRDKIYTTDGNGESNPTIGFGHKITPGEFKARIFADRSISQQEALGLLNRDMAVAESSVQRNISVKLTQYQFDALVSFAYQQGSTGFANSSVNTLINQGRFQEAAEALRHYSDSSGDGRVTRRGEEADLFTRADYKFTYDK